MNSGILYNNMVNIFNDIFFYFEKGLRWFECEALTHKKSP